MTVDPKNAGVAWATAQDGHKLPVIDVTHPCFALADDAAANAALSSAYVEAERRRAWTPRFVTRLMLSLAARQSGLLHALLYPHPQSEYLDGLTTYILKLGAENLPPPFDGKIDRRIAGAPPVVAMRLRLQQCATLLAEGLKILSAMRHRRRFTSSISGAGPRSTA